MALLISRCCVDFSPPASSIKLECCHSFNPKTFCSLIRDDGLKLPCLMWFKVVQIYECAINDRASLIETINLNLYIAKATICPIRELPYNKKITKLPTLPAKISNGELIFPR